MTQLSKFMRWRKGAEYEEPQCVVTIEMLHEKFTGSTDCIYSRYFSSPGCHQHRVHHNISFCVSEKIAI